MKISKKQALASTKDLKSALTDKELLFLEAYLAGGVTIDQAMLQAGYGNFSQDWRYQIARKIVNKYEVHTEDGRIMARKIGAGEVFVLETLYALAKEGKSELTKLNATAQLAKILGMTKEQIEGAQGISIIFEGTASQAQPAAVALHTEQPIQQAPVRVLQITK